MHRKWRQLFLAQHSNYVIVMLSSLQSFLVVNVSINKVIQKNLSQQLANDNNVASLCVDKRNRWWQRCRLARRWNEMNATQNGFWKELLSFCMSVSVVCTIRPFQSKVFAVVSIHTLSGWFMNKFNEKVRLNILSAWTYSDELLFNIFSTKGVQRIFS